MRDEIILGVFLSLVVMGFLALALVPMLLTPEGQIFLNMVVGK